MDESDEEDEEEEGRTGQGRGWEKEKGGGRREEGGRGTIRIL